MLVELDGNLVSNFRLQLPGSSGEGEQKQKLPVQRRAKETLWSRDEQLLLLSKFLNGTELDS